MRDGHSICLRMQATRKEDARPPPELSSRPALPASNARLPVDHPDLQAVPADTPAGTRYADSGCQVGNAGERDRGHAGCFDLSLNQSYGPAADRSTGDQQDDVHPVLLHMLDHAWHAFSQQYLGLQDVSHIGVVVGC
ncbi:MAG: hypothetical protein P8Y14_30510 [Anaerolineales bacterium]